MCNNIKITNLEIKKCVFYFGICLGYPTQLFSLPVDVIEIQDAYRKDNCRLLFAK